jgi:hypothetical protein
MNELPVAVGTEKSFFKEIESQVKLWSLHPSFLQ